MVFVNRIVYLLKSPNSANMAAVGLTDVVLVTIAEKLKPRTAEIDLRRTPIAATSKTANIS